MVLRARLKMFPRLEHLPVLPLLSLIVQNSDSTPPPSHSHLERNQPSLVFHRILNTQIPFHSKASDSHILEQLHPNRASGVEESPTKTKFKVINNVKRKRKKTNPGVPSESQKKFKIYYLHYTLKDSHKSLTSVKLINDFSQIIYSVFLSVIMW